MLYFVLRTTSRRSTAALWDRLPVVSNLDSHPFLFSRRFSCKTFPSNVSQNQVGQNVTRRRIATWTLFRSSTWMKVNTRSCINDYIYIHGRKYHQLNEHEYLFLKDRFLEHSAVYLGDSYEAEIIDSYEENTEEKSLFEVLQYMVAVLNPYMLLPRPKNELCFQDDRLTSAFQTILNTGLIENSTPNEILALLEIGPLVSVDADVRRFYLELEKPVGADFHSWEPLVALKCCRRWMNLSSLHQYMYLEKEIRLLILHTINESKNLQYGDVVKLLSTVRLAMIKGKTAGYHWLDKGDFALCTKEIGALFFDNEANAKRVDVDEIKNYTLSFSLDDDSQQNIPIPYMWKILDVLKTSMTGCSFEEDARKYAICFEFLLSTAASRRKQKGFDFKQYFTELESLIKVVHPHFSLIDQWRIASGFHYHTTFYDQEMAGRVIENFMNGFWDEHRDYIPALIELYVRYNKPDDGFVGKVCSILTDRNNDVPLNQLLKAASDLIILGYSEVYDGLLDRLFLDSDLKELESVKENGKHLVRLVKLYQALEVEKVDRYVQHIPSSHYHLESVQQNAKLLMEKCQGGLSQGLLATVQSVLGGPEKARVLPFRYLYRPIVEFCVDEMNQPVNLDTVPEVFDSNGFVLMENVSALPSNLKRIAVLSLGYGDTYGNKPNVLTVKMKSAIRFLNGAGYTRLVLIPASVRKTSNFTHTLREKLKKMD